MIWGRFLVLIAVLGVPTIARSIIKDPYKVLGLDKSAKDDDIKRAYRKQALKYHPDKNPSNEKTAEERFKEVGEAYSLLETPEKRKQFDRFGHMPDGVPATGTTSFQSGPGSGGQFRGFEFSMNGEPFSFSFTDAENLFESVFGGEMQGSRGRNGGGTGAGMPHGWDRSQFGSMFGSSLFDDLSRATKGSCFEGGRRKRRPHGRGSIKAVDVHCTLDELYRGVRKKFKVTDSGAAYGRGGMRRSRVFEVPIEPGSRNGTSVTFPPRSGLMAMKFIVREKKHKFLKREGNDLVYQCFLSKGQAKKGVKVTIPLPGGRTPAEIHLRREEIRRNTATKVIPQLGMPVKGSKHALGKLKVEFSVLKS